MIREVTGNGTEWPGTRRSAYSSEVELLAVGWPQEQPHRGAFAGGASTQRRRHIATPRDRIAGLGRRRIGLGASVRCLRNGNH